MSDINTALGLDNPECDSPSTSVADESTRRSFLGLFGGRARRREYWSKVLIPWILLVFVSLPMCLFPILSVSNRPFYEPHCMTGGEIACVFFGGILGLSCYIAMWPVTVRRLHDKGLSGWWILWFSLLSLIPYVGWIAGVAQLVIVGCLDGFPGPNEYGADPKGRNWAGSPTQSSAMEASTQPSASNGSRDIEARLRKLGELKATGLITEGKYGQKRATIISEL